MRVQKRWGEKWVIKDQQHAGPLHGLMGSLVTSDPAPSVKKLSTAVSVPVDENTHTMISQRLI